MDKKLPCGLISFYCNIRSIYYSDENIKDFELVKIYGAYFARSTLFNALTIYDASAYEYYGNSDFNEIKKLINKLNPIQRQNNLKKAFKMMQNDVKLNEIKDFAFLADKSYKTANGKKVNCQK